MNWKNALTKFLSVDYPVIQAPMLVVTTPAMIAAAAEMGCLGMLPLGYSSVEKAGQAIAAVKAITGRTFGVNVFAYPPLRKKNPEELIMLKQYYRQYGLSFPDPMPERDPYTPYTDLIPLLLEEKIPVVSFHFGLPESWVVEQLHAEGVRLMATATCVREAQLIEERGLDAVIAQGIEAGGNRGTFLEEPLPQVGLLSLLPQIRDAVDLPVVAAGGIMQPRSAAAAVLLGASGIQVGSLLLRSRESGASPPGKTKWPVPGIPPHSSPRFGPANGDVVFQRIL